MSTLKTTYLQHPSATSPNLELKADGTVTVLPNGILQTIQTVKTDTFTSTSTSFVDVTGLTATITPSSASNKILVVAQIAYGMLNASYHGQYRISGGNSTDYVGDAAGSRTRAVFGGTNFDNESGVMASGTIVYLDAPATTSAVTYSVQGRKAVAGGSVNVNRTGSDGDNEYTPRGASSITVMEIAG